MEILNCFGNLEHYGRCEPEGGKVKGKATLTKDGAAAYIDLSMECIVYPYDYCRMFTRDRAAGVTLDLGPVSEVMAQCCVSPFWARPLWAENVSGHDLQFVLLRCGDTYIFVLPLVSESFAATASMEDGRLEIHVNMPNAGALTVSGTVAVLTSAADPYQAVRNGFRAAWSKGLVKTPPKEEKNYPNVLNKLGWCTWNAFYHDVTEEKLFAKLEEFREKQIPVKWVLIDDGWSEFADMKLNSIFEDRVKFPQGLRHTVEHMKTEYGIEKVGVWHSLTGYWFGLKQLQEDTVAGSTGRIIPSGYGFFSRWHQYLAQQGVDFVKVDCQGNTKEFLMNQPDALQRIAQIMDGLEQSAEENFDFMINCMGMNSIHALQHRHSALLRSSDDFFPDQRDAFHSHVQNNVYNAVFMDALFYCDYDMWWSEHFDSKRNAVLRYFSGGPVYLSDEVEKSSPEWIRLFTAEDGSFRRPEAALKPTYDCLFGYEHILKAFTKAGEQTVLAAFSFERGGVLQITPKDFNGKGKYRATALFGKESFILEEGAPVEIFLPANDTEVFFITQEQ